MDIKIGIAAHKEYKVPSDAIYLPIQVGAQGKETIGAVCTDEAGGVSYRQMARDDEGENISERNPKFCELTGLYWIWKNLQADYSGLVHYRRHFAQPEGSRLAKRRFELTLGRETLEAILGETDIVLPVKRNYYIESIGSHYAHSHYEEHLEYTRQIIGRQCPEYLPAYEMVLSGRKAHMFNMMIMKKDKLDAYCSWMFPIIFELDRLVDDSEYDDFQKRFPGRVSEILLDVWLYTNGYKYHELPVMMMERVHWGRKITSFLAAKFLGKRYKSGF